MSRLYWSHSTFKKARRVKALSPLSSPRFLMIQLNLNRGMALMPLVRVRFTKLPPLQKDYGPFFQRLIW